MPNRDPDASTFEGPIESAVGTRNIPAAVLGLGTLPAIDYADLFTLRLDPAAAAAAGGADVSPEQWARAMFGNVPSPGERLIWRGLLGLRLARGRSPVTVGGWRIGGRGDGWIRLEAASGWLAGNLLVQTADGRVSLATFLHYRRRVGGRLWPPLSAIHRRLVPGVLRGAAARVGRRRALPGASPAL